MRKLPIPPNTSGPRGRPPAEDRCARAALCGELFNPARIPPGARAVIENFDSIIDKTHPLTFSQRQALPIEIQRLSRLLTYERGSRRMGYMNRQPSLSAYARYFMWWNLVRLTTLFGNLGGGFFDLKDGDVAVDIGSGPLTAVTALFLACPALRRRRLTFYCMDISAAALAFGENVFLSVAACLGNEPWRLVRVKGGIGTALRKKASLVIAANVFNEIREEGAVADSFPAGRYANILCSYLEEGGKCVLVEPGDPHSAGILTSLRAELLLRGMHAVAPCPHDGVCPMPGGRGREARRAEGAAGEEPPGSRGSRAKWCNFTLSARDAPARLSALSKAAGVPKERLALSFVALAEGGAKPRAEREQAKLSDGAKRAPDGVKRGSGGTKRAAGPVPGESALRREAGEGGLVCRVASEPIRLPGGRRGYYCCSARGLVLLVTGVPLKSGQEVCAEGVPTEAERRERKDGEKRDKKSGALVIEVRFR